MTTTDPETRTPDPIALDRREVLDRDGAQGPALGGLFAGIIATAYSVPIAWIVGGAIALGFWAVGLMSATFIVLIVLALLHNGGAYLVREMTQRRVG